MGLEEEIVMRQQEEKREINGKASELLKSLDRTGGEKEDKKSLLSLKRATASK